jgi:glycosyltransferase involved in cell wall biosynthesis
VDEWVDKGGWNLDKTFDRAQYKFFKNKEKKLLNHADHTIVLTNQVTKEVCKISNIDSNKITVIPCCADFKHFSIQTKKTKAKIKKYLKISENSLVFGFLGSVGSMYLLEDYLRFVELIHLKYQSRDIDVFGLIITSDLQKAQDTKDKILLNDLKEKILVLSASREEVPKLLHSLDVLISFITSTYARQGASPTKIAESLACGIPIISNKGIGDVENQVNVINGGKIINDTSIESLQEMTLNLDQVLLLDRKKIRCKAKELLSLDIAIERYKDVYSRLK